jgi:hypothetical protein
MVLGLPATNDGINLRMYTINHGEYLYVGFARCQKYLFIGQNIFTNNLASAKKSDVLNQNTA